MEATDRVLTVAGSTRYWSWPNWWLLTQPAVASVIAGATSSAQVRSNATAASWKLSDTELAEVDGIVTRPS